MATLSPDVTAAVASLQARWGAAAPRVARDRRRPTRPPRSRTGRWPWRPRRHPAWSRPDPVPSPRARLRPPTTGSSTPGSPRSTRSSGPAACRARPASRSAATARAAGPRSSSGSRPRPRRQGSIVAWLDLSRSFDPVEAVARGIRLEWLVVITPETLDEGLAIGGALLAGRSVDLLVLDLPGGRLAATDKPARIADRLGRLAALARRSETLLVVLEPPGLAGGLATAVAESTGVRLELARRSWIRLGRDIVGQRTEALVARNRYGPPGRRATLRILYAEGGERDACLGRDDLLIDRRPPIQPPRTTNGPTAMRLLHLHRPHLPLELARARASEPFPAGPLILGGRPWDPGPVIDASPDARALGVRRGMPLGSAHRLVPEATFIDPDPDADRATVEAAFEALAAFSPGIAGSADPLDAAFGLFEVQVDGLEPLWGPEPVLVERLVGALGRAGRDRRRRRRRAGAEPDPGGHRRDPLQRDRRRGPGPARGAASSSRPAARPTSSRRIRPGLLTADPDVRARLTRFGLRRIGAVAELARSALVARFGEEGARIHARSRGEELEPFRPRRAPERLALGLPIEPAVEDLEPLRFVLHRLAVALTGQLVGARAGRLAGAAPPRPGPGLRPGGHAGRAGRRAALPRADRRRRGDRAPAVRPPRTDPATGRGRPAGAGAGRHGAGGRSAAPVVHATGRPRRPARLAAGAARPDLRGGSGPARGRHRSRGAAARDALGVASGRLGRRGVAS